jgi:hypothetical protein
MFRRRKVGDDPVRIRWMINVGREWVNRWWNASVLEQAVLKQHIYVQLAGDSPALLHPAIILSPQHDAHVVLEILELLLAAPRTSHIHMLIFVRVRLSIRASSLVIAVRPTGPGLCRGQDLVSRCKLESG